MPPGIGRGGSGAAEDTVLATTASVFGPRVDMGFQLGRLIFQFPRDVFTDTVHCAATAGADFFFIREVVLVVDLPQLVPIDLAPFLRRRWPLTSVSASSSAVVESSNSSTARRVQIEQMALSFAFAEPLSPSAECPALVPSQFIKRGGVLLFKFLKRSRCFVQHTAQFRWPAAAMLCSLLLKLHRLLVGGCQELVALGQIIRQRIGVHPCHQLIVANSFPITQDHLGVTNRQNTKSFSTDATVIPLPPASRPQVKPAQQPDQL